MSAPDMLPFAGPDALSYIDDAAPFSAETLAVLATPVNPELVEVRQPNDLLFVPWIHYQTILIKAFGPGGFRMVPKGPPRQQGNVFTWHGSLWVRAPGAAKFQFIDEAVGECNIQSAGNGAEGAKSDCLVKCTKRLGIFMELFDPAWRRAWEVRYKGTHQRAKQDRQWVARDRAAPAPAKGGPGTMPGSAGRAPAAAPAGVSEIAERPDDDPGAPTGEQGDTGEVASHEQLDAIAEEIKRRGLTLKYIRLFFKEHFGLTADGATAKEVVMRLLGQLTEQQAATALVKIMQVPAGARA